MTAKELFDYLIQDAGLDEATAAVIAKVAGNEKVAAKAGSLKQQSDLDALNQRLTVLHTAYEGEKDKPGAKSYVEWYNQNFPKIQKLQADFLRYQERYGALDGDPANPNPSPAPKALTADDVARIVSESIQKFTPNLSNTIVGQGVILERHLRAQRKSPIDWTKVTELAAAKNGDLVAAYEEWDRPEAEAAAKSATDKEVDRRVKEELAKRSTAQFFPAGADATPSSTISPLGREAGERKYDRNKVVAAAVTGQYDGGQVQ